MGFSLLRLASPGPMSKEEAYLALKTLREDTWENVADWRINLADANIVEPILQQLPEDPSIPDDCPNGEPHNPVAHEKFDVSLKTESM